MKEILIFDAKAKELAKRFLFTEAELLQVLIVMRKKRYFVALNYSGIFEYCVNALKLSRAQSFYFMKVAEMADEVPEINTAIQQGEITLSQARRIVPVITPENKNEWIAKAKELPQVELERQVTEANPNARPMERIKPIAKELSEFKTTINKSTEEDIKVLRDILAQKLKRQPSLEELLSWMAKSCREKFDPEKKADRTRKVSFLGNRKVGRQPIPQSVKHQVVKKIGFQCNYYSQDGRRCEQKRWLDFHHIRPVSKGGQNTPENLTILCSNHHSYHHSENKSLRSKESTLQAHG